MITSHLELNIRETRDCLSRKLDSYIQLVTSCNGELPSTVYTDADFQEVLDAFIAFDCLHRRLRQRKTVDFSRLTGDIVRGCVRSLNHSIGPTVPHFIARLVSVPRKETPKEVQHWKAMILDGMTVQEILLAIESSYEK